MAHSPLYVTYDQIKKAVGVKELLQICPTVDAQGIADPAYPSKVIDESSIEDVIDEMCDFIDSFIGGVITVPITGTVPGLIVQIAKNLTISELYRDESSIPLDRREKREEAIGLLKEIQNGKLKVHGATAASSGVTLIQPHEAEERGQYDDDYNEESGLAFHMGQYD